MAGKYQIIYWRDIPSQIKAKVKRKRMSRPLADRFMVSIDAAAMKSGDTDTDEYLEQWKPSEWMDIEGEPNAFLDQLVEKIESEYPRQRLAKMAKNGGWNLSE